MKKFLLLIGLLISMAKADGTEIFEPADFKSSGLPFDKIIKFPKVNWEGTMVIRCDAHVSQRGELESNFCLDGSETAAPFVSAINRAARNGKIKPAKINGVSRGIWFQYYVVFTKKDKESLIEVVPNSGLQMASYGTNYTSAQRYKEDKGKFAVGCGAGYAKVILVKAIIGVDGKAKAIEVEGDNLSEKCKSNLINDFSQHKFIPAFFDGKAIDSYYSEDIFNRYREW